MWDHGECECPLVMTDLKDTWGMDTRHDMFFATVRLELTNNNPVNIK